MAVPETFLKKMDEALREDFVRFDEDFDSWSEQALDIPGGEVLELLEQIPSGEEDEYYNAIDELIKKIGKEKEE